MVSRVSFNEIKKTLLEMNHQPASKFVVLPKNSIGLYAESVGHANLPENILASLSEDVTFRIRETINVSLSIDLF